MATFNSPSVTFQTGSLSTAEFVRLFTDHYNYQTIVSDPENPGQLISNPETRQHFYKKVLIRFQLEAVRAQRHKEAESALNLTDNITAE